MVIRRVLLDVLKGDRRYRQIEGGRLPEEIGSAGDMAGDPGSPVFRPGTLALFTEVHEEVEQLPPDQREVFDLCYYQGLTQAEAAQVMGISERTVGRLWIAAQG